MAGLTQDRTRAIARVFWTILLLNLCIAAVKYGYGTITHTGSMQADGIHSLFDSAGNIVGLIGMAVAGRPADASHNYGHGKYETVASAIIGALLIVAAYNVAHSAILEIMADEGNAEITAISFVVMVVTLGINITMTLWEHHRGKQLGSEVLMADAKHTLSDVLVTASVLVGLVFIRMGYWIVDPIVSLVVAVAIAATAVSVFRQAGATLSDTARIPGDEVIGVVCAVPGVNTCHAVRTRGSETSVYVDLHVLVDPTMSVHEAHEVAETVEKRLCDKYPQVVDVVVHVEPDTPEERAEVG